MTQRVEKTSWSGFFHILMILSGTYSPFLSLPHSLFFCLPLPLRKIPEIWIRIAPLIIHDLISMCHSDLIGLDTTSRDLKGLKMFLLDSVCLALTGEG